MILTNDEKNTLVNSLLRTFSNFPKFTFDYICNLLNSIENGQPEYDGIIVDISELENSINPYLYLSSNISNAIYYHLCQLAQEDSDILLELVESKKVEISMICRKYNITDDNQKESYLMEAINLYDGKESFRLFINHYITFKITGKKYNLQEGKKDENPPTLEELKGQVKKFKKKKKKDKQVSPLPEKSFNHAEIKTNEETKAQEQAVQDILDIILSPSSKKKKDSTNNSEDKVVAKEVEVNSSLPKPKVKTTSKKVLKKKKKSEEVPKPSEEVKVVEEQVKVREEPKEVPKPSEEVKVVEEPVEIAEELVEKDGLEKPVENKSIPSTEEVSVTKKLELSSYQRCLSKTKNIVGQEICDDFVRTVINLGIIYLLDYSSDKEFEMYILLRFGFINESFYTIEQIASIIEESIQKVLTYENMVLKTMKDAFDNKLNAYQDKILSLKND